MYEDKTLVCKECGKEFVFTAGEQEFYAERGFQNEPQRCKACRDARKNAARGPREYFTATCAACGGEAKVPFEPKSDRPVYCSECFAKMREQAKIACTGVKGHLCVPLPFVIYGGLIMEITRETLISEIIDNCPQAFPVFQEIGMHCMGCALASGETLEQACAAHGVDPDEFLTYLKAYLEVSNP